MKPAHAIKSGFVQIPFFLVLLPVFFVLHGYVENYGYVQAMDCCWLVVTYLLATALGYLLFYWVYRERTRTALALVSLQSFYFFFGAVHEFFFRHALFVHRYVFFLPLSFGVLIVVLVWLKKTRRKLTGLTVFLNVLFSVYLLLDGKDLLLIPAGPAHRPLFVDKAPGQPDYRSCDTCPSPDIYFLLFDEYASSASLKERYGYDNSGFNRILEERGFHIQRGSHSNYNSTAFSMASILNMGYLEGLANGDTCTIADYAACNTLIRDNALIPFLSSRHYEFVNYSIFGLSGKPAMVDEPLLPTGTSLITAQTFSGRIRRDIGWNMITLPFPVQWIRKLAYRTLDNNNRILEAVKKESRTPADHARFVYAHLEMPHNPFYYDRDNRLREPADQPSGIRPYLDYLPYTNSRIKGLIDTIQLNTHGSAVIVFMGDHGFRWELPGRGPMNYFENQNAVYFPDKDYHLLYDSISGVNQFRVLINKLFDQRLPLLKDSVVFLTDKK
ncbi:MAG TPA: sulfatase-like hydrolase/transferase [Puia sp.]|nr:sulfatase-like hydrolase/transferase [Puia sp.]